MAAIAMAVSSNSGRIGRQAAVVAAASGLVLTSGVAANGVEPTSTPVSDATTTLSVSNDAAQQPIAVASTVRMAFATSEVTSTPAAAEAAPAATAVKVQSGTVVPTASRTAASHTGVSKAATAVADKGVRATIMAAAYAQIGVHQDCTMLVTNSLAAAGIFFHGWPAGYLSLGRTVSAAQAQPGDLIYYDNAGAGMPHIAVYVGNGMAIHGGFNGENTALATAYLGSGPVFIAIGH